MRVASQLRWAAAIGAALAVLAVVWFAQIVRAHGDELKAIGPRHGYNCPDFPESRCPEVVNVSARGLWPPDDAPRANWAFLALIFSACRVGAYDVPPSPLNRGSVHWLWGRCEW